MRVHELKPLYSAEQQRLEALLTMAQATANAQLAAAFQAHLEQDAGAYAALREWRVV